MAKKKKVTKGRFTLEKEKAAKAFKKLPKKKAKKKINWLKAADDLASLIARMRAGECHICGLKGEERKDGMPVKNLQAHHIICRTWRKHRWELDNLCSLCDGCHRYGKNKHGGASPHRNVASLLMFMIWLEDTPKVRYLWDYHQANKRNKGTTAETPRRAYERLLIIYDDEITSWGCKDTLKRK